MPLIRKLRTFRSMSAADRLTVFEALALPVGIALGFRMFGVPRTQALLRRWALDGKTALLAADHERAILSARRAQFIVKRLTGVAGNCLVRSLTLWAILLRRGISTNLRVGFRKRDDRIQGHAWIEYGDAPVNEDINETRTFAPYSEPVTYDLWRRLGRNDSAA